MKAIDVIGPMVTAAVAGFMWAFTISAAIDGQSGMWIQLVTSVILTASAVASGAHLIRRIAPKAPRLLGGKGGE